MQMTSNDSFLDQAMPRPPPCVLLLNGFPGVGKLTTAKSLASALQSNHTPYRLIDNHLLIDPVIAIEPTRNQAHYTLRKEFRRLTMDGLNRLKNEKEEEGEKEREHIIIWTAALSTSHLPTVYDDIAQFFEYLHFAKERGVPLVFVNITCDLELNCERVVGREEMSGKGKLCDASILEVIRRDNKLLTREEVFACAREREMEGRLFYFELDNSRLGVEEGTARILQFLCGELR